MWHRRDFIKGLGLGAGATLLMPLLREVQADEAQTKPRRFVIFVEGNGVEPRALLSAVTAAAIEAKGASLAGERYLYRRYKHDSPIIVPDAGLASASSLTALGASPGESSLEGKAAVILGLTSKITGGGHSTEYGALSCTRSQTGRPAGATIDHVLSGLDVVRDATPFRAVRLGVAGTNTRLNYATCAFGERKPAPIITSPTTAFNTLFGSVASAAGRAKFDDRKQLLDFAAKDMQRTLGAFAGSSRERQKLEQYLTSLEEMIERQTLVESMGAQLQAVKPADPADEPLYTSSDPLERFSIQTQMATAALLGGLTNVVVMSMGTGASNFSLNYESLLQMYPGQDMLGGHDVRHAAEKGAQPFIDILHAVTREQVKCMAQMARKLEATPEVGAAGSMLDHTVMLYMSDNGEKHHSNAEEWAMLMLGGQALGFKTDGRSVVYPKHGHANNRQVSNVFNSLGHAAGQDLNTFGSNDGRIEEGPLSELWS